MKRLMIVALLAALCPAASALADGCIVAPYAYEIWEVGQIAYLDWDADTSTERLHILPRLQGDVTSFAWIVPVPSLPELDESDAEAFRQLAWLTQPETRRRDEGWSCEQADYLVQPADNGGVDVIAEELLGIYDSTILAASDAGALTDSLTAWGFLHTDNADDFTPLLDAYVQDGWYFVTLRVDSTAFADMQQDWYWNAGLDPIALSFATDAPVYPMRISALSATDDTSVIIYANADARLDFDGAETEYANALTEGEVRAIRAEYPQLGAWLEAGDYLTKLRRRYTPAEMDADVYLVPADSQAEFRRIYYSGVPVTTGLLLAIFGAVWWRGRRGKRAHAGA